MGKKDAGMQRNAGKLDTGYRIDDDSTLEQKSNHEKAEVEGKRGKMRLECFLSALFLLRHQPAYVTYHQP